jgi:LPXTG-site transpeptidase (sortase) family protein
VGGSGYVCRRLARDLRTAGGAWQHRPHNTTNGEVFRDLYTLQAGDVITSYAGDIPHAYTVTEVLILPEAGQPLEVRIENARYILPTDDERLTLVTCHPYGSLRYRLIVIAHPQAQE